MIKQVDNSTVRSTIYGKIRSFLECEFSYIESQEDVYDLENYNYDDDLYEDVFDEAMLVIKDNMDEYDLKETNDTIEEDLSILIDKIFYDVRDELVNRFNEKFEMADMLYEMDEYDEM